MPSPTVPTTCLRAFVQRSAERSGPASIAPRGLACFSTSAAHSKDISPKGRKGMVAPPKRGTKTLNVKKGRKGVAQASGKPPAPGERKALRKRIVLSNNNALEVASLQDLSTANALSPDNEGKVRGIPEAAVDMLRAVEAFKPTQGWAMFRRPAVLMRKETMELARLLTEAETAKKTVRRILTGERMSGKSTLVLQGLTMAYLRGWVVINLPEAQDIVNAHTEYAPLPGSQPMQYTQDAYTANLLSQILKGNERPEGPSFFASTPVTTNPTLPLPLPAKCTLKQLIELGIANPDASWPVFVALWKELTQPGRPPVFLAVDGLSHIMRDSEYLSADVKPIHAHDLSLIRHFVDHLSGTTALPNGGMVLGAMSSSNSPANPALDFSIQVAEARQFHPENMPRWNPYRNVDQRVMECLKHVDIVKLSGLTKEEARSIMEYYAESGMLRAKVNDGFVSERWSLAGMGNIGELERASVRLRV